MDVRKVLRGLALDNGAILAPHIDIYQERARFPRHWDIRVENFKPDDGDFHPSGHCFMSARELYFNRLPLRDNAEACVAQREIGATLRRTFDCGHMWHGYLGSILIDMKFVKPENVERHVNYVIGSGCRGSGTADLVDVSIPNQGTWLVDMKTMNKREFEQKMPNEHTFKKWEAQVNCYMDWVGAERAMILAIEKDSPHRFREFQIQRKPGLLATIYERWQYVTDAMRERNPPPCEHPYGAACSLGDLCTYEED